MARCRYIGNTVKNSMTVHLNVDATPTVTLVNLCIDYASYALRSENLKVKFNSRIPGQRGWHMIDRLHHALSILNQVSLCPGNHA